MMGKVFTTHGTQNFITSLAHFVAKKTEILQSSTFIFPSNRACLQFKKALAPLFKNGTVLPKLLAINDQEVLLEHFGLYETLPTKPIHPTLKETTLSLLVQKWKPELPEKHKQAYTKSLITALDTLIRQDIHPEVFPPNGDRDNGNERLEFLRTTLEHYPKIIEEMGYHDPLYAQKYAIQKLIEHLNKHPLAQPLLMAGFSQCLPDTLALMKCIFAQPFGQIALPFVENSFVQIEKSSPYFHTQKILESLVSPQVFPLEESSFNFNIKVQSHPTLLAQAQNIANMVKESPRDTSIAIVLPSTISQDYIEAALTCVGVSYNSSLSTPFSKGGLGSLMMTFLDCLQKQEIPEYMALLKHPLFWEKLSLEDKNHIESFVHKLTTTPQASLKLQDHTVPLMHLFENVLKAPFLQPIQDFLKPYQNDDDTFDTLFIQAKEASQWSRQGLKKTNDIEMLQLIIMNAPEIPSYTSPHAKVNLIGLMEARLCAYDHLIILDMNEGVVPRSMPPSPWLSGRIRSQLNLMDEEEYLGLQAQDFFLSLTAAAQVTLSHRESALGEPSLPSPFFSQISNNEAIETSDSPLMFKNIFPAHQRAWSLPPTIIDKPKRLSASAIQTLMNNPYGFYAKYILKLKPREHLTNTSFALVLGQALHEALDFYAKNSGGFEKGDHPTLLNYFNTSVQKAAISLSPLLSMRLSGIARALCVYDTPLTLKSEVEGECAMGEITLFARLDALLQDIGEIWDYKTGAVPTQSDVAKGLAPQLPLEGLIFESHTIQNLTFVKLHGKAPYVEWKSLKEAETLIQEAKEGVSNIMEAYLTPSFSFTNAPMDATMYRPFAHLERMAV